MEKTCPHCGASLPEGASFCPHCASDLSTRRPSRTPRFRPKRVLPVIVAILLVGAGFIGYYTVSRPETYEGQGEVFYSADRKNYQLTLGYPDTRNQPTPSVTQRAAADEQYRFPMRFYINDQDTGSDANEEFMKLVDSVSMEVHPLTDTDSPTVCSEPAPMPDYSPDAALITLIDFTVESGDTQMVWNIKMKNGDQIRLSQDLIIQEIPTYNYRYQDTKMDTISDLQALLDQIARETAPSDIVNIYLPPVTYEGKLVIDSRPFNFYGCTEGRDRTTFTDTVQLVGEDRSISYFYDIDFVGDGTSVGLSAGVRARATRCNFSGWKTGMLGYGYAWVNLIESRVENCEVGFHFNSTGDSASHSMFNDNTFLNCGTAVLLENVPTDLTLNFDGSSFSGNKVNIDNRCQHSVNTSEATFD